MRKAQRIKEFDSSVFLNIPRPDLESAAYRIWVERLLSGWLSEKEGMEDYRRRDTGTWNEQGSIQGTFYGRYISHCKLYKIDQTDFHGRARRGVLIRDHYSEEDVEKVMFLADRFGAYLKTQGVKFRREYMRR